MCIYIYLYIYICVFTCIYIGDISLSPVENKEQDRYCMDCSDVPAVEESLRLEYIYICIYIYTHGCMSVCISYFLCCFNPCPLILKFKPSSPYFYDIHRIIPVQDMSGGLPFNQLALQRYILHCGQQLEGGGLRDKPGKSRDYYHSCYALSGLSIAQSTNISSNDSNTAYCDEEIPQVCLYIRTNKYPFMYEYVYIYASYIFICKFLRINKLQ
jgi:hypothetical protein